MKRDNSKAVNASPRVEVDRAYFLACERMLTAEELRDAADYCGVPEWRIEDEQHERWVHEERGYER